MPTPLERKQKKHSHKKRSVDELAVPRPDVVEGEIKELERGEKAPKPSGELRPMAGNVEDEIKELGGVEAMPTPSGELRPMAGNVEDEIKELERVEAMPTPSGDRSPLSDDMEDARVEAWEEFHLVLDDVIEEYLTNEAEVSEETNRRLVSSMNIYRTIAGVYPYFREMCSSKPAFALYLTEGIKPEILEDVRPIVARAIEGGNRFPWTPFREALLKSGRDWREWPDRELYISSVSQDGGAKALCEAAALGFVDHRLEHAIITLQRLIRYRNAAPPPKDPDHHRGWLAAFERLHHQPEPDWEKHGIHLKSFGHTSARFPDDEQEEIAFVRWNPQCVPEFILELARLGHVAHGTCHLLSQEHELSRGIEALVGEDVWRALGESIAAKRERLYRENIDHLLDDDALSKTNILIRLHAEGKLGHLRNARRDVLKYVSFQMKEPVPAWVPAEKRFARATPIAKCHLERLDAMPLSTVEEIFRVLPKTLASYGRALMQDFVKLHVQDLKAEDVRKWVLDLIIDDAESICSQYGGSPSELEAFLRRGTPASDDVVGVARSVLLAASDSISAGKPLYSYSIWVEPVSVTPVLLPGFAAPAAVAPRENPDTAALHAAQPIIAAGFPLEAYRRLAAEGHHQPTHGQGERARQGNPQRGRGQAWHRGGRRDWQ